MKQLVIVLFCLFTLCGAGCRFRVTSSSPRVFSVPEHRSRHHWGAPKYSSVRGRYWGAKRYGPRPHPQRGHYRY